MRINRYFGRRFFCSLAKDLIDPFSVFYACSWFVIRGFRQAGAPLPILNNWLTDFVFVPLLVHFSFVMGNLFLQNEEKQAYPLYQVLLISAYTTIVFEWIAPQYFSYHTADWIDVVMYFAGGLFYYTVHQPYARRRRS